MTGPTPPERPRLSLTSVRYATAEDLPLLAGVESAAASALSEVLGVPVSSRATPREEASATPEVLLAVGHPVLGFARLLDLAALGGSGWHLENLAVHPAAAGRGVGRMLVRAAMGVALERGECELTTVTFAEVAGSASWLVREGFAPVGRRERPEVWARLAPLRATEGVLGLAGAAGRRVAMVRTLSDEPAPRRAVSVIPVRRRSGELEVFVQHRALTMDFAPGAVVFPGGRVDPVDERTAATEGISVARACAVREVAEEAGAVIEPAELVPWDRWVTPVGYPKRFDVDFFLLPVADGEDFVHQTDEATRSEWTPLTRLVRATEAGEVTLVPPTRTIVDELSALGTLEAVLALQPEVAAVRHDLAGLRPRRPPAAAAG